MDNAYWLWTFQGRLLQKNSKDRFCQLLWRPRPPTLLGQDQVKVWLSSSAAGTWQWPPRSEGFLPDTVRVTGVELWLSQQTL